MNGLNTPFFFLPVGCGNEEPSRNAPLIEDDPDLDGVMGEDDQCPNTFANTANGCPVETVKDSDGDGIPDSRDKCPLDSHPGTEDGCLVDPGRGQVLPRDAYVSSDTLGVPGHLLREVGEAYIRREGGVIMSCPHLSLNLAGEGAFVWQENNSLFSARFYMREMSVGAAVPLNDGDLADPNLTLCNIKKSVAVNSQGDVAVVWASLTDGNVVHLKLNINGISNSNTKEISSFPLRSLGEDRLQKIASVAAFENGDFVVVWVDHDMVKGQVFDNSANAISEAFIINRRALDVLSVMNPDVAIHDEGSFDVIWQEGSVSSNSVFGEFGALYFARVKKDGQSEIGDTKIDNVYDRAGGSRWAGIAENIDMTVLCAKSDSGYDYCTNISETWLFGSGLAVTPEVALDKGGRLAMAWLEDNGSDIVPVQLASAGEPYGAQYLGSAIGETFVSSGVALASTEENVVAVYVVPYSPFDLAIKAFEWAKE